MQRTRTRRLHSDKKVVYFHGCATMYYEPFIGKAAVAVLEHNGFEVIVPPQNCCGLPMLSNGEFKAAAGYHRSNVARLAGFARAGLPVVGTSTSCTLTLKEEAPELLDMHDAGSTALKQGTWDIFEFLADLTARGELRTDFRTLPLNLPYHAPCQQTTAWANRHFRYFPRCPELPCTRATHAAAALQAPMGTRWRSIKLVWMWVRSFSNLCVSTPQALNLPCAIRRPVAGSLSMAQALPAATPLKFLPPPHLPDLKTHELT